MCGSDDMVHKITYSNLCVSTLCTLQFPLSVYKLLSAGFICLYHTFVLTVNSSEQGGRGVEEKTYEQTLWALGRMFWKVCL